MTAEGIEIRGDNLGSPAYKTMIADRALPKAAER